MLVLTRRIHERVVISDKIIVQVLELSGGRIRLGFDAPADVSIRREELVAVTDSETNAYDYDRKPR